MLQSMESRDRKACGRVRDEKEMFALVVLYSVSIFFLKE